MATKLEVKFRYGSPVTPDNPVLIPGSFVFDNQTLALYIDTMDKRVQVKDPLKLSLTGGTLTGNLKVINEEGTTTSCIKASTGVISGRFLETTGDIYIGQNETRPTRYAVIDDNGRIRALTRDQMKQELNVADINELGNLAFKNNASTTYTPMGIVTTPTVTINYGVTSVVSNVTSGDLPNFQVSGEILSLFSGTQDEVSNTNVVKSITSINVSQPQFIGTTSTITVQ